MISGFREVSAGAEAVFRDGRLALEKLEASGCGELYERALRELSLIHI